MVEQGLFERFPCDAVYALHNWPDLPLGHAQTRPGPIMAAADRFDIVLRGRGGHAAQPHRTPDVLLAASQLVVQLQHHRLAPHRPGRIGGAVGHAHRAAAVSHNVLPAEATITGTVRSFDAAVQDRIEAALRDAAAGVALAHGVEAEVDVHALLPGDGEQRRRGRSSRSRRAPRAGLEAERRAAAGVHVRGLRVHAAQAAGRLPVARPGPRWPGGRRRATAAPPLLRLQRRRAAATACAGSAQRRISPHRAEPLLGRRESAMARLPSRS